MVQTEGFTHVDLSLVKDPYYTKICPSHTQGHKDKDILFILREGWRDESIDIFSNFILFSYNYIPKKLVLINVHGIKNIMTFYINIIECCLNNLAMLL